MLSAALRMMRKDLTLLTGRGTGMMQSLLLGLLLIFLFSLSGGIGERPSPQAASAIFWMSTVFCMVQVFNALYALEESNGQRHGLLLAPVPLQSIWLGKGLAGLVMVVLAQVVFLPTVLVFLDQNLNPSLLTALGALVLADFGLAAVGALLGALAQGQAARESLLCVVIFPLLLPLLLAAIRLGAAAFSGVVQEDLGGWFRLLIAFDALFLAAGLVLFQFIYGAQE